MIKLKKIMLTQKKMFVHYSGTLAQFKETNYPTEYANSIVFIGNGEAIYAKGKYYGDVKDAIAALQQSVDGLSYFRGIKAGNVTAWAADKNGVITFTSGDNSVVTVNADTKGVHINLKQSFVDDVTTTKQGLANEITRATNAENKIKADLGTKDETKGTAFERIADIEEALEGLGTGTGSISSQILSAINAEVERANAAYDEKGAADTALAAAKADAADKYQVKGDYEAAGAAAQALTDAKAYTNTEIGKLSFDAAGTAESKANAALEAAKSYADGLASNYDAAGAAAAAESAAKAYADGLASNYDAVGSAATAKSEAITAANQYTDGKVSEINDVNEALAGRVKANEGAIAVLNDDAKVEGSVKNQVATAIASVVNGAPGDFDTLKEVADWIASDTTGAAKMQSDIATLNSADTVEGSVAYQVKVEADRAKLAELGLSTSISNLDAADTELLGKITALEGVQDNYATKAELTAEANRADAAEKANAAAIKTISDDYLKAADKEALQGAINTEKDRVDAIVADYLKAADKTELSNAIATEKSRAEGQEAAIRNEFAAADSTLQGNIDDLATAVTEGDAATLKAAKSHVADEIAKLKFEDELKTDQFVTSVSETAGKISVTRSGISASQIKISNTEDDLFDVNTVTVQDALTALADAWTWAEL